MISPIQQSTLEVKLNMRVYVKAPAPNLFLFLVEKQAMISLQGIADSSLLSVKSGFTW